MATSKNKEVKPGWKSTEFWVTVVVALSSLLWGGRGVKSRGCWNRKPSFWTFSFRT